MSSVDEAGDVIKYTILVQNIGNITLTDPIVEDSQVNIVTEVFNIDAPVLGPPLIAPVLDGDYNAGDTNQNGIEDPGETFQFAIVGDLNDNGIEDPGETFVFTNVGDTNQNGSQDPGETWEFYNIGDTDQDDVEDPGETFVFLVSHAATAVDDDHDGFNDGDTNMDGQLDLGETWQYTVSYTVTQDDIDNGGVVDEELTHDNTATATASPGGADADSVSVSIDQNPHLTLVKTATVPGGTADAAGEVIEYDITITNDGNMTLTGVDVTDPSVSDLAAVVSGSFNVGDLDTDGKLDLGESWQYTASHTVTQAEIDAGGSIDNTAAVTTDQAATSSDDASITIVQNPHVTLVKTATVPGGTADVAGEVIDYDITIANDGNVTLTDPVVSDPSVSDLAAVTSGGFNAGDSDMDGVFDVGELWQYTASHTVTQAEMDAGGSIANTASVTTDQGASSSDDAAVTVAQLPGMTLVKAALGYHDTNNNNVADVGEVIDYKFTITNTGNITLHDVGVNDVDANVTVTGAVIAGIAPGTFDDMSWAGSYAIVQADVDAGFHENDAVATALEANAVSGTVHTALADLFPLSA